MNERKPLPSLPKTTTNWKQEGVGSVSCQSWNLGDHQNTLFKKEDNRPVVEILTSILDTCVTEAKDANGRIIDCSSDLPLVLGEMAFIKTREVSVGDTQEYIVECDNPDCECKKVHATVDLKAVEVKHVEEFSKPITIGGYRIVLKLPTISFMEVDPETLTPENIEFVANNIESICDDEQEWDMADYTLEERVEFVETLPPAFPIAFIKRYQKLPYVASELVGECPECKTTYSREVSGIGGLFTG